MECTAKTILIWFTILQFTVNSKTFPENDDSKMFFEGQSFLQHNMTEMSNSAGFGTDCETRLWFKPTKRHGIVVMFASNGGTWTGIGLKDGYLR